MDPPLKSGPVCAVRPPKRIEPPALLNDDVKVDDPVACIPIGAGLPLSGTSAPVTSTRSHTPSLRGPSRRTRQRSPVLAETDTNGLSGVSRRMFGSPLTANSVALATFVQNAGPVAVAATGDTRCRVIVPSTTKSRSRLGPSASPATPPTPRARTTSATRFSHTRPDQRPSIATTAPTASVAAAANAIRTPPPYAGTHKIQFMYAAPMAAPIRAPMATT